MFFGLILQSYQMTAFAPSKQAFIWIVRTLQTFLNIKNFVDLEGFTFEKCK